MRLTLLSVPITDREAAADRLWAAGAAAVEERTDGDRSVLVTVLADDDQVSHSRLGPIDPAWSLHFEDAPASSDAWRAHAVPVSINDELVLVPAWVSHAAPERVQAVRIDPGAAFGLGDHPTTRLSADAAWRYVRPGDDVLDVGCGTGVLAIVAVLRGAGSAVGIDISEAARQATEQNAAANSVADRVTASCEPLSDVDGRFDVVFANILAPTLVELSDGLRRVLAPGGRLVVSGILADRHDHVLEALQPLHLVETVGLDGWACVVLVNG